jgi:hypothetical protein
LPLKAEMTSKPEAVRYSGTGTGRRAAKVTRPTRNGR